MLPPIAFWLLAIAAQPQSGAQPQFEVASLKSAGPPRRGQAPLHGGPGSSSPGQLSGVATMKVLLMRAYNLKIYQIAGPAWLDSERYEVDAKIPNAATEGDIAPMLQALLRDRVSLAVHFETRNLPVYALLAARGGTQMKISGEQSEATANAPAAPRLTKGPDGLPELAAGSVVPRTYEIVIGGSDGLHYKVWVRHETMQQLADRLSTRLDRPVLDRTALQGHFDFTLSWTADAAPGVGPHIYPPPDQIELGSGAVLSEPGQTIFGAVQSQLGLRLRQEKGSVRFLMVDRIEKTPSGNLP